VTSVIRAACVYAFLLIIFRIAGKRTLAQITTFDLVLTLIISEAIQQAMVDTDNSMTNAFLLVVTLVCIDLGLSMLKQRSDRIDRIVEGAPVIILDNGRLNHAMLRDERICEAEILTAARQAHGLERMEQIKYAIVEQNGRITIVPQDASR
jgi:uncharacterized membrane protein YcaP (DUF421 family)